MTSCDGARPAPLRCPTQDEVVASALALLPRGRAWQSNEGGPREGTVLHRFWTAIGSIFTFVNQRFCDLRWEFWCATQAETNDAWLVEYGLPNACDPYPDLCTKVAAIGGTRCEFYQEIAARAGWSLTCSEGRCGSRAKGKTARAGHMRTGRTLQSTLRIIVDLEKSPAFSGSRFQRPLAGRFRASRRLACGPDLGPIECILARVVHAEIQITYEAING